MLNNLFFKIKNFAKNKVMLKTLDNYQRTLMKLNYNYKLLQLNIVIYAYIPVLIFTLELIQ